MSGTGAGRSMVAQETIEMPAALVATQQELSGGGGGAVANRSDDEGNSSSCAANQTVAANGSFKMDESFQCPLNSRGQNSNSGKEGNVQR